MASQWHPSYGSNEPLANHELIKFQRRFNWDILCAKQTQQHVQEVNSSPMPTRSSLTCQGKVVQNLGIRVQRSIVTLKGFIIINKEIHRGSDHPGSCQEKHQPNCNVMPLLVSPRNNKYIYSTPQPIVKNEAIEHKLTVISHVC